MWTRRSGGEPETATTEDEEDLVIDLRERLAPYEFEHVGNPQWRETLIAADQRRLKRRIIRRFALR